MSGRPPLLRWIVRKTEANLLPRAPWAIAPPRGGAFAASATETASAAISRCAMFLTEALRSTAKKCVAARGPPGNPTRLSVAHQATDYNTRARAIRGGFTYGVSGLRDSNAREGGGTTLM